MISARDFIDHHGTRHGTNYAGNPRCDAPFVWAAVTLRVRDCPKCFPPSPDFSSSTLTDLQEAQRENRRLRDVLRGIAMSGCSIGAVCLDGQWRRCSELDANLDRPSWCSACVATAALVASSLGAP